MRVPQAAPILTAAAMRAAEAAAFAAGASQDMLMERAGAAVAREAARFAMGRPVLVLAGPGNNGGDAWVVARRLKAMGHDVRVAALGEPRAGGAAARMRALWDGAVGPLADARSRPMLVDGLFGTGLSRPLDEAVAASLHRLADEAQFRLAIDLSSGLDTDSGAVLGAAAMDATVALGVLKPAHLLYPAAARCGRLFLADIGVPVATDWRTAARPDIPPPGAESHKFSRGLVLVAQGAMPGAAMLAARAAASAGAGYVMLAGEGRGGPDAIVRRAEPLAELVQNARIGAVVLGPGLGRTSASRAMLDAAIAADRPLVLDGDALSLLATDAAQRVAARTAPTWLTPHGGEFDRMFPGDGDKISRTIDAARESGATIVHKGADTVIATPQGEVRILSGASGWLSTAGSGDVLAGTLGARVAAGGDAEAAVWLHARAASHAGSAFLADDLVPALSQAVAECR
jgi:ADP-dependent NAD(P)H-hydrate dehydratase / NAD(P)H-hydrate epimerase